MNSLVTIPPRSLSEHASKAQGIIDIGRKKHLKNRNLRDSSSHRRPSWSAGGSSRRRARTSKPEKSSFRIEIGQPQPQPQPQPRNQLKMTDHKPRAIQCPPTNFSTSKPIIIQKRESIASVSVGASVTTTTTTNNNNTNDNHNRCTSMDQETDLRASHIRNNNPPSIVPTYQNSFYKSVQQPCQNKYYQRVQKKRPKDTSTMTQIVLSPTRRPPMGFGTVSSSGGAGVVKTSRTSPMDSTSCHRKEDDHSDMHTLLTSSETATFRCDDESSFWVGTSNASECHGHHGHDPYHYAHHVGEEEQGEIENSLNRNHTSAAAAAAAVRAESFERTCIPHPNDVGNSRSHGSGYIWGSSSQLDMCDSGDAHNDFDSMASDRVAIEVRGQVSSDDENESKPKIPENISFYTAGSQYLSLRDLLPSSDKIAEDVEGTIETAFGSKSSGESIILQDDSTEAQGFQQVEEDTGNEMTIDLFSKKRDPIECNCAIM